MTERLYKLRYLPLFYDDLKEETVYIAAKLQNRKAANDLIDAVEEAILKRLPFAEAFELYHSKIERKYPYYRIYVKNYVVYYVVIEEKDGKVMEVRRFLHKRQDGSRMI